MKLIDREGYLSKMGVGGNYPEGSGLAPWVWEAIEDYREKLGLSRRPDRNARWKPPTIDE